MALGNVALSLAMTTFLATSASLATSAAGLSNGELARRGGAREQVVRRMLDPGQQTSLKKIPSAYAALAKRRR
jgi:hypothetical protein